MLGLSRPPALAAGSGLCRRPRGSYGAHDRGRLPRSPHATIGLVDCWVVGGHVPNEGRACKSGFFCEYYLIFARRRTVDSNQHSSILWLIDLADFLSPEQGQSFMKVLIMTAKSISQRMLECWFES